MRAEWLGGSGPEDPDGEEQRGETRPYGSRPYGSRPYGSRPYGSRPYGSRPYGSRPYGSRPYGSRPYGSREELPEGGLEPEEWSADVGELFCSYSALVRLGARLVFGAGDLPVPTYPLGSPAYLPAPGRPSSSVFAQAAEKALATAATGARSYLGQGRPEPGDHELAVEVVVRNRLLERLGDLPEVAWALKEDLARGLATSADGALLDGSGAADPLGIARTPGVDKTVSGGGALAALCDAVTKLRHAPGARFDCPGWIFGPKTLDRLTRTDYDGRTLETTRLLKLDGGDGGKLLGYPFVVSPAAAERVYFGSDWAQAWIASDPRLVAVKVSPEPQFATTESVLRAVMYHDLVVVRPNLFTYLAELPD